MNESAQIETVDVCPANETDWTSYYKAPFKATTFTRERTANLLVKYLSLWNQEHQRQNPRIIEIGGANSCFYARLRDELDPSHYAVLDMNEYGLDLFRDRFASDIESNKASAHTADVLDEQGLSSFERADIVFSVGLIEHFDPDQTAQSIRSHFALCKPGGLVVITFPTPTLLYRTTRSLADNMGKWIFHDERPLKFPEVESTASRLGTKLKSQINWPIILTQGIVAYRAS
jgi:hypothetical protein